MSVGVGMVDARGPEGIAAVERSLEASARSRSTAPCSGPSSRRLRDLAATGSHGAHSLPLTDLTVTVAAEPAAAVEVLHFDQHLERLGEHLGIESHWISDPRGESR
jgi:hypothetical protein